jgi:LysR family transcriptional regulator, glycine cleavage system transcriptional activator
MGLGVNFAGHKRLILLCMREEISRMSFRRLPPLNAVRAFVTAAKHASFTLAAAELGVTHGAISHQIKQLEQHFGMALFTRSVRQVTLTSQGQELFAGMVPALERIAATAEALTKAAPAKGLRINVRASFAARWLIPQLPNFMRLFPNILPQVITTDAAPERLGRDSFDVIIRRSNTGWPVDLEPQAFLSDSAYLVAGPSLIARQPVHSFEDLRHHIFLHSQSRGDDWRNWLRFAGAEAIAPAGEMTFDHLDFALRAASDGLGLAIGPAVLVAADIKAGRLCQVFPDIIRPLQPYRIALSDPANVTAQTFMQWISSEAQFNQPA